MTLIMKKTLEMIIFKIFPSKWPRQDFLGSTNQDGECQPRLETSLGKYWCWDSKPFNKNICRDQIWVIISVEVAGTMAITQQMSKLEDLGSRQQEPTEFNPFRPQQPMQWLQLQEQHWMWYSKHLTGTWFKYCKLIVASYNVCKCAE